MTFDPSKPFLAAALAITTAVAAGCSAKPSPTSPEVAVNNQVPASPTPAPNYRITGAPALLAVGETSTLQANQLDADGASTPVAGVTWFSTNTSVARVDAGGALTATGTGAASIGFAINGQTAATENVTVVVNVAADYHVAYTTVSCSGWICDNAGFRDGALNSRFTQAGSMVWSSTSSRLWGSKFRGTVGSDRSLDVSSYVCDEPDYEPGVDVRLHDMRLAPDSMGGFAGTGRFTHRVFSIGGTCSTPLVSADRTTTGIYSVQITRR